MLGECLNGLNEEVIDMVGEIINMVIGGVKWILVESGFDFDMVIFVVVFGWGYIICYKCEGVIILMLFFFFWGNVFIEICFE